MDTEWKFRIEKEGGQYIIVKVRNITSTTFNMGVKPQQGKDEEKEYWTGRGFVNKSRISDTHIFYSKQDAEKGLASI